MNKKGFLILYCLYVSICCPLPVKKTSPTGRCVFLVSFTKLFMDIFYVSLIFRDSCYPAAPFHRKTPIQLATVLICLWLSMCVVIHIHNNAETYIFEFSIFRLSGTKLTKQWSFLPPSPCFKVVDGRERRSGCFKTSPQLWGGGRWGERGGEWKGTYNFMGVSLHFVPDCLKIWKLKYMCWRRFLSCA